jgi:hypothetical protein
LVRHPLIQSREGWMMNCVAWAALFSSSFAKPGAPPRMYPSPPFRRRIITLEREVDTCRDLRRHLADATTRAEEAMLERDAVKHAVGVLEERVASCNRGEAARLTEVRAMRQEVASAREAAARDREKVGVQFVWGRRGGGGGLGELEQGQGRTRVWQGGVGQGTTQGCASGCNASRIEGWGYGCDLLYLSREGSGGVARQLGYGDTA